MKKMASFQCNSMVATFFLFHPDVLGYSLRSRIGSDVRLKSLGDNLLELKNSSTFVQATSSFKLVLCRLIHLLGLD